jgi:hypothetical protein
MDLLDEIVSLSCDSSQPISDVLRKCLVLAYHLKNDRLKEWVEKELNGFAEDDELPSYREVSAISKGFFLGAFGSEIRNQPIPPGMLKEEHRKFVGTARLVQPIAAYEMIPSDNAGSVVIEWPPNLTILYQKAFFEGDYALNRAWREIPKTVVKSLVEAVRNRVLQFALEIKEETTGSGMAALSSVPRQLVERHVTNIIFGGQNVIAGAANNFSLISQSHIELHDAAALAAALERLGLSKSDISELHDALQTDTAADAVTKQLGTRTAEWIKKAGKKIASAGSSMTVGVATDVVRKLIFQFLGWT